MRAEALGTRGVVSPGERPLVMRMGMGEAESGTGDEFLDSLDREAKPSAPAESLDPQES